MDEKNKATASKSGTGAKRGRPAGATKKVAPASSPAAQEAPVIQPVAPVQPAAIVVEPPTQVAPALELHTRIPVRNAFPGGLTYRDGRTGLMYGWKEEGDVEFMELGELRTARSTQPKFFEKNWWEIDEVRVLEWLNATKFYKGSLMLKDFDVLFSKSPDEIIDIVAKIPEAQRENLILRVRAKVAAGEIDSLKVVRALEGVLGVKLSD